MNAHDTLRHALLGAIGVQTGLIAEQQLLAAWEECRRHPATPFPAALFDRAGLSPEERSTLEYLVARSLARHADDPRGSLGSLALAESTRATLTKLEGVAVAIATAQAPPDDRRRRLALAVGVALAAGAIIVLATLLGRATLDGSKARGERDTSLDELRQERARSEAALQRLRQTREELEDTARAAHRAAEQKVEDGDRRARAAEEEAKKAAADSRRADDFAAWVVRRLAESPPDQAEARRRELLEQALQYYQGQRREDARDRAGRRQTATACLRAVPLYLVLSQDDAAEKAARRALALLEELGGEGQSDAGLRQEQAWGRSALAAVLQRRNRPRDALAELRASRELLAALVKEEDGNLDLQEQFADTLEQLADTCRQAGQPDEALAALKEGEPLRTRLAVRQREQPEYRARLAALFIHRARLHEALRQPPDALRAYQQALPLCQKLAGDYPRNASYQDTLAAVCMAMGDLLRDGGRPRDAQEHFAQAAAGLGRLPAPSPGQRYRLALCHLRSGYLLAGDRPWPEAIGELELARGTLRGLVGDFPARPEYREELTDLLIGLGNLYHGGNRLEEGEKAFQEGIRVCEQPPAGAPSLNQRRRHGTLHYNLGNLYRDLSKPEPAEKQYRAALALRRELEEEGPRDRLARWEVAMASINLGNLLQDAGRHRDAEKLFAETIVRLSKLADEFPDEPEYRRCQAMTQCNVGNLLSLTRDYRRAEPFYAAALQAQEALSRASPKNPVLWADLSRTNLGLGNIYQYSGRLKEAEASFDGAIRLCQALTRGDNPTQEHVQRLGVLHFNRGNLLRLSKRYKEAKASYEKALAPQGDLLNRYPESALAKHDLAQTRNNLAMLLADCPDEKFRDPKEALDQAQKAARLEPTGGVWNTVGLCFYRAGQWKESREALEKAMKLRDGGDASDWYFLAMALWQLGERDAARNWLARADRWTKEKAPADEQLRRYREEAAALLGK
jgi:tetratricopeptide (TPR) repeat protein